MDKGNVQGAVRIQLPDRRSQKRLKSIYQLCHDNSTNEISYHKKCEYKPDTDDWRFSYYVSPNLKKLGEIENPKAFEEYCGVLKGLADEWPRKEKVAGQGM